MTEIQLTYTLRAAQLHSISLAAAQLHVSQPSVSVQISRLEQGIGSTANRLTMDETPSEEEEPEIISHFNGTPLVPSAKPITKSAARPESMHHVVEQQLFQNNE